MSFKKIDWFDDWGLICKRHANGWLDGGDTPHRTCHYYFALYKLRLLYNADWPYSSLHESFDIIEHLECPKSPGNFRRHPDQEHWYSQCNRMSRDQYVAILCFLSMYYYKATMKRAFKAHLKRGLLFTTNTKTNGEDGCFKLPDLTLFDVWGIYIRGLRAIRLRPLLWLLDIELVLSALFWKHLRKDDNDIMNFTATVILANDIMPTIWSRLATRILSADVIVDKWRKYFFRTKAPGDPKFMPELWEPLIREYFK